MAFKLKGFPMHQGTSSFKRQTEEGGVERKGGERTQDTTPSEQDTTPKRGDLSKMPFGSAARIAEYKRRGWAMDETTRAKPEKTKETEAKKTEKDTSKSEEDLTKKWMAEGATKVEKKELTPKQKRQLKRERNRTWRAAVDKWRAGGSKGPIPVKPKL
jgi:hypothetical protein